MGKSGRKVTRFAGKVFKAGKYWAIEVPILDIATQGRTKKEAYEMIADAVESLVNKKGFEVRVFRAKGKVFEIGASDQGALTALLLRRMRQKVAARFPALLRKPLPPRTRGSRIPPEKGAR